MSKGTVVVYQNGPSGNHYCCSNSKKKILRETNNLKLDGEIILEALTVELGVEVLERGEEAGLVGVPRGDAVLVLRPRAQVPHLQAHLRTDSSESAGHSLGCALINLRIVLSRRWEAILLF